MATIVAVRSGNWSDTSHVTGPWPGEMTPTTKPGVGDTVQTGAYAVTIDDDVHVALLEATSGSFLVNAAPTLPEIRQIVADVTNSGITTALEITNPTGIVFFTGDVTGGGGGEDATYGIYNGGTMGDVVGNVIGGDGAGAFGIYNAGTIGDVVGNVTSGTSAYGIYNGGTMGDVVGNVTSGSGPGDCGIYNAGTMGDVVGNVIGGGGAGAYGIYNAGTIGDVDGSLICGANGLFPIFGPFKMVADPANAITVISSTDAPLTLSNDYPAEADVKDGVDYNRGTMTGELVAGGSIGPVSIVIGGGGIRIS